jgi:MFS family permease
MSGFVAFGGARTTARHQQDTATPASGWTPLRRRIFLALWVAALASNLGTWMQNVGAAWLMTSLSKSPLLVSLLQTASSLPIFFLALPAGALADIVDRRGLLIFSQAWMLAAAVTLGIITILGRASAWSVLGLSFLLGVGATLNAPAWQAIIPDLVPRNELGAAVTLNGINFNLARAAGPALGGLVVAWLGAGANFLLNAASFLGVMIVLYEWRPRLRPNVLPAERVIGAIRAGMRYVRYAPPLRAVLARTVAFTFGGSAIWALLPLIARWQLHLGAAGFGLLVGWFGFGAVIAGAMMAWLQRAASHDRIVHLAAVVFTAVLLGLTLTHDSATAGVLLAFGGAAWVCAFTVFNVAAQLSLPGWVQGRALAVYQIALQGGMAGASALWGFVATKWGLNAALECAALSMLAGLAAYAWRLDAAAKAETDRVDLWPSPHPSMDIDPNSGPALTTIEYRIDPARTEEFIDAMRDQRLSRLRNGAVFWGLFVDLNQPERFVEHFVNETWGEHLRQHDRLTAADTIYESRAKSYHVGETLPVTHLLAADALSSHNLTIIKRPPDGTENRSLDEKLKHGDGEKA